MTTIKSGDGELFFGYWAFETAILYPAASCGYGRSTLKGNEFLSEGLYRICPQTRVCGIGRHIGWQWERPSEN